MKSALGFISAALLVGLAVWALQAGGGIQQLTIAALTAGLGYMIWRSQHAQEHAEALAAQINTDKRKLYQSYVDMVRRIVEDTKAGQPNPDAYVAELRKFAFTSMLTASDSVLRAQIRFSRASGSSNRLLAIPAIGDVLLELRRDAGHPETMITPIELMSAFITDIAEQTDAFGQWSEERSRWDLVPSKADR